MIGQLALSSTKDFQVKFNPAIDHVGGYDRPTSLELNSRLSGPRRIVVFDHVNWVGFVYLLRFNSLKTFIYVCHYIRLKIIF